jgi:hypothetical protein
MKYSPCVFSKKKSKSGSLCANTSFREVIALPHYSLFNDTQQVVLTLCVSNLLYSGARLPVYFLYVPLH